MIELKTWVEVADTAVKIGLGAIITGIISLIMYTLQSRQSKKAHTKEIKERILEEVIELTNKFNKSAMVYLASRANAAWKLENNKQLTAEEEMNLKDLDKQLFQDFTIISTCKAKLALIGAQKAKEELVNFKIAVDKFFKIARLSNEGCTEAKLVELRGKIEIAMGKFHDELSIAFYE